MGNSGRQESHLCRHLPAQTQTPGGGRSGHICSSAQHGSLTKQCLGQAASPPPPTHTPQLPAGGQAWLRCRKFFPLAAGLLLLERGRKPFRRWCCGLLVADHSRSFIFHTAGASKGQNDTHSLGYTERNAPRARRTVAHGGPDRQSSKRGCQ